MIAGLKRVKAEQVPDLPLAFFTWHDRLEANHRNHVWHELQACYDSPSFEGDAFLAAGVTMLDPVRVFWDGLYAARAEDASLPRAGLLHAAPVMRCARRRRCPGQGIQLPGYDRSMPEWIEPSLSPAAIVGVYALHRADIRAINKALSDQSATLADIVGRLGRLEGVVDRWRASGQLPD